MTKNDLCLVVAIVWLSFVADILSTQNKRTPEKGVTLACVSHLHRCRGRNSIFKMDLGHGGITRLDQVSKVG